MSIEVQAVAPGVHRVEKIERFGFARSMFLFELPGGGLLVHSPTWCGEGTFEAVEALGPVRALLAPNHFHHLSLPRFRDRWPEALAVCAPRARARLEKKGHAGLVELDALAPLLPAAARAIACEMKNGEAWLVWPTPDGPALVVCDGFFHLPGPLRGVRGWALRRLQVAPGLCFGQTSVWVAIDDKAAFVTWATATLDAIAPVWLWPSHGECLHDPALAARLGALLRARLIG